MHLDVRPTSTLKANSKNQPETTTTIITNTINTTTNADQTRRQSKVPILATVPVVSMGQYRHQPSSRSNYNDNSPFLGLDDDDDEYSAYFPSGQHQQQFGLQRHLGQPPDRSARRSRF
jgi:hypothetical protein